MKWNKAVFRNYFSKKNKKIKTTNLIFFNKFQDRIETLSPRCPELHMQFLHLVSAILFFD